MFRRQTRLKTIVQVAVISAIVATTIAKDAKYKLFWPVNYEYNVCNDVAFALADYVNHRADILPEYELVPDNLGWEAGPNVEARYFFDKVLPARAYVAPIYSGQDGGCEQAASTYRAMRMIQISQGCSGAYIQSRRSVYFNNLYSTLGSADTYKYAGLEVIRRVGHWRQVGIFYSWLLRDTAIGALNLFQTLTENGIVVKQFIGVRDMSSATVDDFLALSNLRIIIVLPSGSMDCQVFLCLAYLQNIRPPHYTFIMWVPACMTLSLDKTTRVPRGCTREIIDTQIAATLFVGIPLVPLQLPSNSSLGISPNELDRMIDVRRGSSSRTTQDWVRYACYDAYMASILVLNETETTLYTRFNLSLRDHRTPSMKELVYKIIDATAARMNYHGLRNPQIAPDGNGQIKQDIYVMQPYQGKPRLVAHLTYDRMLATYYGSSGFVFHLDEAPIWATRSGQAPNDLSTIEHRLVKCGERLIVIVASISGCLSLAQVVLLAVSVSIRSEMFFEKWKKILVFGCCLSLNGAAAFIVTGSYFFAAIECRLRPILTTAGVSLLHGFIFAQLLAYSKFVKSNQAAGDKSRQPRCVNGFAWLTTWIKLRKSSVAPSSDGITKDAKSSPQIADGRQENIRRMMTAYPAVTFPSFVIFLLWVIFDPMILKEEQTAVMFDVLADTYYDETIAYCSSPNLMKWLGSLLGYNAGVILLANFFSLIMPDKFARRSKLIRLAAANAAVMLAAVVLIFVAVGQSKMPCMVNAILAFCHLIYSATMSGILLLANSIFTHNRVDVK